MTKRTRQCPSPARGWDSPPNSCELVAIQTCTCAIRRPAPPPLHVAARIAFLRAVISTRWGVLSWRMQTSTTIAQCDVGWGFKLQRVHSAPPPDTVQFSCNHHATEHIPTVVKSLSIVINAVPIFRISNILVIAYLIQTAIN